MTTQKDKPKILFLHHAGSTGGGAEASLYELVTFLRNEGRLDPYVGLPFGTLSVRLEEAGIPCFNFPITPLTKVPSPGNLWKFLRSVHQVRRQLRDLIEAERIDLVHANSDHACLYAALALPRDSNVPLVWHGRDLAALGPLGTWLAKRADRIVAISAAVANHLLRYTKSREKLETIANGTNTRFFAEDSKKDTIELAGLDKATFVVGMVGQYVRWKNHSAFIKAAQLLAEAIPDAHFIIAGACHTHKAAKYRVHLEKMAYELGIRERITFTEKLNDVRGMLHRLNCLVHPAECEPFGRGLVEAMAAGSPVVAVDACGPGEIVTDMHDGLLVPSPTPYALAEAVIRIKASPELAERLGTNAAETARNEYDISRVAFQIQSLYRELLG